MSVQEGKPKPEPKALSPEYHKARKQLMLWAGILLIWELVGVDLDKAKDAEGNVGALVKSIKSPQAVPWVLLILVAYLLFKVTVEWCQCSPDRRRVGASRIDFISAWIVSLVAYALYIGQAISRVQFADLLQSSNKWQCLFMGFFSASSLVGGAFFLHRLRARAGRLKLWDNLPALIQIFAGGLALPAFAFFEFRKGKHLNWWFALAGIILGATAAYLAFYREYKRRSISGERAK